MMAITASNSISVKPRWWSVLIARLRNGGRDRRKSSGRVKETGHPIGSTALTRDERQGCELRLGGGRRPQADLPRPGEGRVLGVEGLLAVVVALDVVALHRHAERRPAVVVLDIRVLERLGTPAIDDLVDAV